MTNEINQTNEKNQVKPNYYAIITAEVRYDKRLSPSTKLLFAEITALTNKNGVCWASNSYFAELYEVNKATISRWVSQLKQFGYIDVNYTYKNGSKEINQRLITVAKPEIREIEVDAKMQGGYTQNCNEVYAKMQKGMHKNASGYTQKCEGVYAKTSKVILNNNTKLDNSKSDNISSEDIKLKSFENFIIENNYKYKDISIPEYKKYLEIAYTKYNSNYHPITTPIHGNDVMFKKYFESSISTD